VDRSNDGGSIELRGGASRAQAQQKEEAKAK
jgi:hypothetical protein